VVVVRHVGAVEGGVDVMVRVVVGRRSTRDVWEVVEGGGCHGKVDEEGFLLVMLSVNEVNKDRNIIKRTYFLSGWARRPKPNPHRLPTPIKDVVVNVRCVVWSSLSRCGCRRHGCR